MRRINNTRLWLGFVALAVVILRIILSWENTIPSIFYFTMQTNLWVALYWLWAGLGYGDEHPKARSWIAGAVTAYITLTMVAYMAFLHKPLLAILQMKLDHGSITKGRYLLELTMTYLTHAIFPLMMLVDYVFFTPYDKDVKPYQWLVYPLVYGIFYTIYGLSGGFFLYPFLDPNMEGGWAKYVLMLLVVFAMILAFAYGVWAMNKWMNRHIGGNIEKRAA